MARRFYEQVSVEETAEGHIIRLDDHKLMTPAKNCWYCHMHAWRKQLRMNGDK